MYRHIALTIIVVTIALALPTVAACTSSGDIPEPANDEVAEPEPEPPPPPPFETYRAEAEEAFEGRLDRDDARRAIESWQRALDDDSADDQDDDTIAEVFEDLARAHYFFARFHVADGPVVGLDPDVSRRAEKGVDAAAQALRIRAPRFHDAVQRGAPFEASLPDAPPEALDAQLWYAKNLELLAGAGGVSRTVSTTPIVESIMESVLDEDPTAFYGAAHRFFGVRWVERPFHRDPDASRQSFDAAIEHEPDFLLTPVLKALHLATHHGDRDQFESILTEVTNTEGDAISGAAPENRIARRWAQELLDRADEFFD